MKECNHSHKEFDANEFATTEADGMLICKECMQARIEKLRKDAEIEV